jgi:N-acetylmuramoyl-L-alanine amidase
LPVPAKNKIETVGNEKPEENTESFYVESASATIDTTKTADSELITTISKDIRFRIQFFISKENLSTSDKKFAAISDVRKYNESKLWKYTSGNYNSLEEAQIHLKEIKKRYADAFIVAFNNEYKITLQEAKELNVKY